MLGRRLLILVAVLMGLTALAASVAPRDGDFRRTVTSSQPPQATPTAPPAGPSNPEAEAGPAPEEPTDIPGEPPVSHLDADGDSRTVSARTGERIRLEVATDELATVQIGDDGPIQAADPDAPARFDLLYDEPGREEVRVLGDEPGQPPRTVGVLRVR